MNILALNPGSSSLKYGLFRVEAGGDEPLERGEVEHAGEGTVQKAAADAIARCALRGIDAVGYRVVHGGPRLRQPAALDDAVLTELRAAVPLAPLHLPVDIALAEAGRRALPDARHVAVFDTGFHATIPPVAATYALPRELTERYGLRRYGFHGISHQYVSRALLAQLGRPAEGTRLTTCHLGNGASVCAVRDGHSVDTSMGMTPLEGLVMGTRCGDIDPGLLTYLMETAKLDARQLDDVLNKQSGLLGVSGRSADVRDLEAAAAIGDETAKLAQDLFAYRVRKYIGAYAAALGGVDAVAFAGGIGERSPAMRAHISEGLAFLGLRLDPVRNAAADGNAPACISADDSPAGLWVIPTDEEQEIAREVWATCRPHN